MDASQTDAQQLSQLLHRLLASDSGELYEFATTVYSTCVVGKIRPPQAPLEHAWLVPGGGYYAQWLWDTMFVADLLAVLPGQQEILRGVFQNYWDFQRRWDAAKPEFMQGMVANFIAPFAGSGGRDGKQWREFPAYSQAPLLAWGMERVFRRNGDRQLLEDGLRPLERFHEWYWRERDVTGVGLIGVGAYSGVTQHARFETYDHEVDLDGLEMMSHPGRAAGADNGAWYGDIAIPANTAYLLASEQSLARLADAMGEVAMARRCRERFERGREAMRKLMWDEAAGCFLAVRLKTLEKVQAPTVGSFVALMAGVPTRAQAATMTKTLAGVAWATKLPVPTVARSDPQFAAGDFWRGDVWPAPNYQVASGLAGYGLKEAASRIADASVANAMRVGISERYDSLTGAPLGVAGLGMSATLLTMMLDGLTSRRFAMRVRR
jgi:putative isomerase